MTHGIHHITAIASQPRACYEFYTNVLGLRLVKKSVNQDQVEAYHLFFGDKTGEPGMDLTFFTFEPAIAGVHGVGQVTQISLAVPEDSLDFWKQRFKQLKVAHEQAITSFNLPRLRFTDHDHQHLELVGLPNKVIDAIEGDIWTTTDIGKSHAIRAFHAARLATASYELLDPVLTRVLGYQLLSEQNHTRLYQNTTTKRAAYLEVVESPLAEMGINAVGTVHHIAFRVTDEAELLSTRQQVLDIGLQPTGVIDRYYFKSVYFRTPAGILFELATDGPGFTVDEPEEALGQKLALPPFLESQRQAIEADLTPLPTT